MDALSVPYGVLSNICPVHAAVLGPLRGAHPVVYSCDTGFMKPNPAAFQAAIEASSVPAARVRYLDDLQVNVDAARTLGFQAHRVWDRDSLEQALADLLTR